MNSTSKIGRIRQRTTDSAFSKVTSGNKLGKIRLKMTALVV
jgi:hypothetical protein